jgi:Fe2+ or Zn2+ uptake regulation protein
MQTSTVIPKVSQIDGKVHQDHHHHHRHHHHHHQISRETGTICNFPFGSPISSIWG